MLLSTFPCSWQAYRQPSACRHSGVQAVRKSTQEQLQALSQADASSACTSWLGQLAKDIQKHCPAPMAACATAADFAALEAHLQAAISQWQPPRQPVTQGPTPPWLAFRLALLGNDVGGLHISVSCMVHVRALLVIDFPCHCHQSSYLASRLLQS